jgi:hypothetical protein
MNITLNQPLNIRFNGAALLISFAALLPGCQTVEPRIDLQDYVYTTDDGSLHISESYNDHYGATFLRSTDDGSLIMTKSFGNRYGLSLVIEIKGAKIGEITPARKLSISNPSSAIGSIDWRNPNEVKINLFPSTINGTYPLNGSVPFKL